MSIVARGLGLEGSDPQTPIVTGGLGIGKLIFLVGPPAKLILSAQEFAKLTPTPENFMVLEITEVLSTTLDPSLEVHTMVLSEEPEAVMELTEEPLAVLILEATDC